jgi:lysophospholipase L1-like esterase
MQILIFGDSITQGFHDDEKGGWVSRLFAYSISEMLASDYKKYISIFNFGVSGDRSCDVIKRFKGEFDSRNDSSDTFTMFAVGTNDYARIISTGENWCPIEEYEKNMRAMIALAKEKGNVALVGLTAIQEELLNPTPWVEDFSYLQEDRDKYETKIKEIAESTECIFIETADLFVGSKKESLADGLHPTAAGHNLIFQRVKEELEKAGIL